MKLCNIYIYIYIPGGSGEAEREEWLVMERELGGSFAGDEVKERQ